MNGKREVGSGKRTATRLQLFRLSLTAFLFTAAALAAACGFHFAGSRPLPEAMNAVYIDVVQPYQVSQPPVETALRGRLVRRGASVKSSAGEARSVLRLSGLKEEREVLSVDAFGKAVEYQLTTQVSYELLAGGQALVPAGVLSVSRDYTFNAQQVLAKEAEEKRLRSFLQDELAELIMLRLESQLRRAAAAPAPPPVPSPPP